jgi:probable F420-dependent oxidoreductase
MVMKLGLFLPQNRDFDLRADPMRAAQAAERIGYDSVWAFERVLVPQDQSGDHGFHGPGRPWPGYYRSVADPLLTLAMAAAVTSKVTLGTAALLPPLHVPFGLARSLASLAALSDRQVVAGLGNGWSADEHAAMAPRGLNRRSTSTEEFLDMADAVWGPDPVSFENERYTVVAAEVGPKPARPIQVFLGGAGEKTLDRVARRAAGWLPSRTGPKEIDSTLRQLRQKAAEYGRNPQDVRCIAVAAFTSLAEVPAAGREPYTGSVDQIVSDIADLAEVGVDETVLTLNLSSRDVEELIDSAAEFRDRVTAAGI